MIPRTVPCRCRFVISDTFPERACAPRLSLWTVAGWRAGAATCARAGRRAQSLYGVRLDILRPSRGCLVFRVGGSPYRRRAEPPLWPRVCPVASTAPPWCTPRHHALRSRSWFAVGTAGALVSCSASLLALSLPQEALALSGRAELSGRFVLFAFFPSPRALRGS